MSDTKQIIFSMLTENTGTHMLDSGGDNGRHWQQNQDLTIEALDKAEGATFDPWSIKYGEISVTINLYHFLTDRLEHDAEKSEALDAFGRSEDYRDEPWLVCMQAWLDARRDSGVECGGIYGEGEPMVVNTYNGEDLLSQTIQYLYWTEGERGSREAFIALQIHGGADVRGGYTAPKVFRLTCYEGVSIFDNARAAIHCDHCDAHWETDDGCHWYAEGCAGAGAGLQLEDYETVVLDPEAEADEQPDTEGKLVFDPGNKRIVCPCCGKGNLAPFIFPAG